MVPFPQASAPCSISHNYLYDQPIFAADSEHLWGSYHDTYATLGKLAVGGETSVLMEGVSSHDCSSNGAQNPVPYPLTKSLPCDCVLNDAAKPIPTPIAKSPENKKENNVPDTYNSLDQSLARVQRSKPRQKDLELQNSVKASKSSLHGECHAVVDRRTIAGSGNAHPVIDHMHHVGLQPLRVDVLAKHGSSRSISEKCHAQVLESSSLMSNDSAFEVVHDKQKILSKK